MDVPVQEKRNCEKEFFNVSPNANPTLLRVIDKIKRDNELYHFVNDFSQREGLPKWDYAMIAPQNNKAYLRDNADSIINDTIIMIPIVPDQSGFVKDILSCFVTSDSIYAQLIKDVEYSNYGYEPHSDGKPDAKDISFLFMAFEKSLFDKEFFDITDRELAKKYLGDDVLEENQHVIINTDASGNVSAYKVDPWSSVPLSTGVIVVGYLPAATVYSPWWMYGLGLGPMGGPMGGLGGNSGWWNPEPTGGGGGGSTGTQGNSGSTTPNPGWQVPPCGVRKMGNMFYRANCPPALPDDIPAYLKNICEKIQQKSIDLFHTADTPDPDGYKYEWSHIIVKNTDGVIYSKNPQTDNEQNEVSFNWYTVANESIIACEHTHQSESSNLNDRPGPDIGDALNMRQNRNIPAFTSFVNCGNVKYALVIENPGAFSTWANQFIRPEQKKKLYKDFQDSVAANPNHDSNYQLACVQALISMLGPVSQSGIGIYKADDANMTNFVKLN